MAAIAERKDAGVPLVGRSEVGRSVRTDWNVDAAIRDGFKASTWVYAANRFIASKISPIPWFVEQWQGDDWERLEEPHPAEVLIAEPNLLMSGQDLIERWLYNLGLAGNALAHMVIVRGAPLEIWPLMPQYIKPQPSAKGYVEQYEYKVPNQPTRSLPAAEVLHMMYVDPGNLYWGMSPLQAMGNTVDSDVAAVRWNNISLANRAKKDYAFFPEVAMTKQQWDDARRQLREQSEDVGGFFLGSTPGKLTEMSMTAKDMDWLGGRAVNKEEILAGYGLDEILVTGKGILRNFEVSVRRFWEDLAIPTLGDMRAEFNRSIMPFWDPYYRQQTSSRTTRPAMPTLRLNYDTSGIPALQQSFAEKLEQAQILAELGYPLNVINQRLDLGLPDIDGGDQPIRIVAPNDEEPSGEREPRQLREAASLRRLYAPALKATNWDDEWRRIDSRRQQWEGRIQVEIAGMFHDQGRTVMRAYLEGGELEALQMIDADFDDWYEALRIMYRAVISDFGSLEVERLLSQIGESHFKPRIERKEIVFSPLDFYIEAWINQYAAQKTSLISNATRQMLANYITSSVSDNQSTDAIARGIRENYSRWADGGQDISVPRSFTIARTETGSAVNFAQQEGARQVARQTNLNMRKRWISSRDERVRDSHEAVDGEEVGLEDRFSNGLLYPLDTAGPPGEVINCRCVVGNVITR